MTPLFVEERDQKDVSFSYEKNASVILSTKT
ncbi:MAG: hypothetical protein CM15mP127_02980 [Gammaproteobacteria bacterium]|nr:MAG: hypothetical protein CM15mP127_02980 [Gammaproteobacteria bacterium]